MSAVARFSEVDPHPFAADVAYAVETATDYRNPHGRIVGHVTRTGTLWTAVDLTGREVATGQPRRHRAAATLTALDAR